jgi:hypothetical protein
MDSLLLKKLTEIYSFQDTLMLHTQKLQESVTELKTESLLLKTLPFIGVIVGGIITYVGQSVLKNREIKLSTSNGITDAINKIFSNLSILTFSLKELAYLETDSKYQYYLSCTESGEKQKKALDEHYNDYKYIAEIKTKIAFAISEIDSSFTSYYRLKKIKIPDNTVTILNTFSNHLLNLKRHPGYDIPTDEEIRKGLKNVTDEVTISDITKLFFEYNKLTMSIKELATELK